MTRVFGRGGPTLLAVALLAIGIGLAVAGFAVADAVVFRDLPFVEPDRLVALWETSPRPGHAPDNIAPANFTDWQARATTFESLVAWADDDFNLSGNGAEPERLLGQSLTVGFFQTLGASAAVGRVFGPDDLKPGAPLTAVLSDRLWRRRFGARRDVIGTRVSLNGHPCTIIGVMAPSFRFPGDDGEVWAPIGLDADQWVSNRGGHFLWAIGRIRRSSSLAQARAELQTIAQGLAQRYPDTNQGWGAAVIPLHEQLAGGVESTLWLLDGAALLVLLLACGNVAALTIANVAGRRGELAIRSALGASRAAIVRLLFVESLGMAAVAAMSGLLLARWIVRSVPTWLPPGALPVAALTLDGRAFAVAAAIALASAVAYGLAPAIAASAGCAANLQASSRGVSAAPARQSARRVVVGTEIALTFVLLMSTTLLIESARRLQEVPAGFDPHGALTMRMVLPVRAYPDVRARTAFHRRVLERVAALPGVESAGVVTFLPLTFGGMTSALSVEGVPDGRPGERPPAFLRVASPGYFRAMRIPLIAGRTFADADTADAPGVIVLSQTGVRQLFNGVDPIHALGRRVKWGDAASPNPWLQVVGVVGDVHQRALDADAGVDAYVPMPQAPGYPFAMPRDLVVRTAGSPIAVASAVRAAIAAVDPELPVSGVRSLDQVVSDSMAARALLLWVIGVFAGLSVVIAAAGLYGVLALVVVQRRREVGVRMALGATSAQVVRLVASEALPVMAIGLVVGMGIALWATNGLRSWLFGVSPVDPLAIAATTIALVAVGMLATALPAWRAARLAPAETLRGE